MHSLVRGRLWDIVFLSAAGLFIACYSYVLSHHRIFWSDELFAWMIVTDPSWKHMLRAWNLGADGGGLSFYALCRVWLEVFGRTSVAFRAFSAAGVFAGLAGAWFSLRRYYRPAVTAIAICIVWFGSHMILWQIVQTRFYGMLLGSSAWALYVSLRSAHEEDTGLGSRAFTLALVFVFNLVLVSTHPFGILYSALLLLGALVDDWLSHRKRPLFYLCAIISWPILIASRAAIHNAALVGKPWFWTTRPLFRDLIFSYKPEWFGSMRMLFLTAIFAATVPFFRRPYRQCAVQGFLERRGLFIQAVLLALVPILFWILSQGTTSYFVDRYFIPFMLGITVLVAELLNGLLPDGSYLQQPLRSLLATGAIALVLLVVARKSVWHYGRTLWLPPRDFTGDLASMLPRGEPVILPKTDIFDVMIYYRDAPDRPMYFPFDWDLAINPKNARWIVSAEREMERWRSAGYYSGRIVDSATLLRSTPHFSVVTDGNLPWLQQRLQNEPGWRVRKLREYQNGFWSNTIWQVDRLR